MKNAAIKITFGLEEQVTPPSPLDRMLENLCNSGLSSLIHLTICEAKDFLTRQSQLRARQRHMEQMELEAERLRQQGRGPFPPFNVAFSPGSPGFPPFMPHRFEVRGPFLVAQCEHGQEVKVAVADVDEAVQPAWNTLEGGSLLLSIARGTGIPIPNPPPVVKPQDAPGAQPGAGPQAAADAA